MYRILLPRPDDVAAWRDAARQAALANIAASDLLWDVEGAGQDLFGASSSPLPPASPGAFAISRHFLRLVDDVVPHRDPERFSLLYRMLLRLLEQPGALADEADPLRRRLDLLAKEVRRDIHKMRAFVRFRELGERFVAWFEPDHHIVRVNAGFFVRRFSTMRWSILTPDLSIHWDGSSLAEGPGAIRADAPDGDPVEALWKGYYASIFNPARLKVGAMLKEMPRKYWANMPETALIPELIAGARARETRMVEQVTPRGNADVAWQALREEASHCTRCDLHRCATQTVFGEGPVDADIMVVGEQPGDQEDVAGRPFVGPAGQLFNRALDEAGIDRSRLYVTNAVKHFKFEPRGKRRIHARPNAGEIKACRWWLDQERAIVSPRRIILLGTTAIHAVTGKASSLASVRESPIELGGGVVALATIHPSYLLRLPDKAQAEQDYARFVDDLRSATSP
ncbi:UdgX family uracil-DNA binding protein [Rhizorhabdus phycosphaerae]|uniref:UdgX family uracil-DNA binding protein n=1 Tax=Rhizorhabdus phycosphaerae TaxID=2711156 RepID=UPI0013EB6352|nr:UdgX family uracil-DNA binding protein [Rhizorhabdus phycosphaerae]